MDDTDAVFHLEMSSLNSLRARPLPFVDVNKLENSVTRDVSHSLISPYVWRAAEAFVNHIATASWMFSSVNSATDAVASSNNARLPSRFHNGSADSGLAIAGNSGEGCRGWGDKAFGGEYRACESREWNDPAFAV